LNGEVRAVPEHFKQPNQHGLQAQKEMERFHSIKCQDFKQMLLLHVRQQVEFHTKARPLSSCRPPGSAALRLPSQSFAPLHHTPSLRFHRAVAFCAHFAQSVPRCHSRWMEHKGAGRSGE
jgi:hypothetical protein